MTRSEIISQVVRWHTACQTASKQKNQLADALQVIPESPVNACVDGLIDKFTDFLCTQLGIPGAQDLLVDWCVVAPSLTPESYNPMKWRAQ